jgi:hypothetical protein
MFCSGGRETSRASLCRSVKKVAKAAEQHQPSRWQRSYNWTSIKRPTGHRVLATPVALDDGRLKGLLVASEDASARREHLHGRVASSSPVFSTADLREVTEILFNSFL